MILTLSLSGVFTASGHPACCSFPFFMACMRCTYIYIYLSMLMYKKIHALTFPRPPSLVAARWGSCAWIEPAALLQ
jgi:hypothetical protein